MQDVYNPLLYGLIIDREKEIKDFIPEEYWTIEGGFLKEKEQFEASFYGIDRQKKELNSEEDVKEVLSKMNGNEFKVESVTKKRKKTKSSCYLLQLLPSTGSSTKTEFPC